MGRLVLGDFGTAVKGDQVRMAGAQPEVFRSLEVMLKVKWAYAMDIWNVGCIMRLFYLSIYGFEIVNID